MSSSFRFRSARRLRSTSIASTISERHFFSWRRFAGANSLKADRTASSHDSVAGGHLSFFTSRLPISLSNTNSRRDGRSATFAFEGTYENQTSSAAAVQPAPYRYIAWYYKAVSEKYTFL